MFNTQRINTRADIEPLTELRAKVSGGRGNQLFIINIISPVPYLQTALDITI